MQNQGISPAPQLTLPDQPLRVGDVARLLGVHPSTVYREVGSGRLRSFRVGTGRGTIRISRAALREFARLLGADLVLDGEVS
ncbi:helix-turn-helix domain-containing protein [Streptomyces sp. NPDC002536]|uniref:helix-turn-helix domain-containing protein n=1 Tax=Streptomyces sp. NPDC001262 TaxID=3364552 RepID=UPI0036748990